MRRKRTSTGWPVSWRSGVTASDRGGWRIDGANLSAARRVAGGNLALDLDWQADSGKFGGGVTFARQFGPLGLSASAGREEAGWRGLVRTYENMRPREAAAIFEELELPVLIQILDRMGERKMAPVIGAMRPEKARVLTAELARHRANRPGSE